MTWLALVLACGGEPADFDLLEPRTRQALVFRDPESCRECHPEHVADWEGSMHAYAMTDPLFHGIADKMAADFVGAGGQFCTRCHSVPGFLSGETVVTIDEEARWAEQRTEGLSAVAQAGVSCDVCHSITDVLEPLNARYAHQADGTVRGPIHDPVATEAHPSVGSALHEDGLLCTGCHNVGVPFTSSPLVIERTGIEWQTWIDGGGDKSCQDCHMPARLGVAAVGGPERTVHAHTFVGVDLAVVPFPDRDRQRALVEALVRTAVDLEVAVQGDPPTGVEVTLANQTGHSVPSGVASERRMWVEVRVVRDADGVVVYESGWLDEHGDLPDGFPEGAEHMCTGSPRQLEPPGDPDLWWFGSVIKGFCEEITIYPHQADGPIEEHVLVPHAIESKTYTLPALAPGSHTLSVRLLFRPLQPHFIRALAADPIVATDPAIVDLIPIYEMASETRTLQGTAP